jgi:hypothetical protein
MIDAVRKITHIAPTDARGEIVGYAAAQEGVVAVPTKSLFLCAGVTDAPYATTTEVYPDSPSCTADQCNLAQVTTVTAALDFVLEEARAASE